MSTDLKAVLEERGKNYGRFDTQSVISQGLKHIIFRHKERSLFAPYQVEALEMICNKIGRMVNGDRDHLDNWVDIAGYATLVANTLQERKKNGP